MRVLLVSLLVLVSTLSAYVMGSNRAGIIQPRITTGTLYFADAAGCFKRDCVKIIEASKTSNRAAIRGILSRYSKPSNKDMLDILRMHSLINATRLNDKVVVEYLVEEFGSDPMAYNGIAMKEAVRTRSLDVLTFMLEHNQNTLTE